MSIRDYVSEAPKEVLDLLDSRIINDIPPASCVRQTTYQMHLYADGTNGSDTNNGLSSLAPKKTIQAVFDLVPTYVNHSVFIHLSGTFTETATARLQRQVNQSVYVVIDGGSDKTIVDDNSGSNYTADINSTSTIGFSGAGWTVDTFFGWWVEILTGPSAGAIRSIQGNTATTITVTKAMTDPGAGAKFRIVRPATTLNGPKLAVEPYGAGSLWIQRIHMAGTASYVSASNGNTLRITSVTSESTGATGNANGVYWLEGVTNCGTWAAGVFTGNFVYDTTAQCGISSRSTSANAAVFLRNLRSVILMSVLARYVSMTNCNYSFNDGCRVTGGVGGSAIYIYGSTTDTGFYSNTAQPIHKVSNAIGRGIYLENSQLVIYSYGGVDIYGCQTHGIELVNSLLTILKPITAYNGLTGSSNGGAGLYAHYGSKVYLKPDYTPTLTGTVGNISLDGTTQASTWAAIAGGTPIDGATVGNTEFVLVKKTA